MADEPQNIDIQVESDVSQAVNSNKLLVQGVASLLDAYAKLEAKLRSVASTGAEAANAQAKSMALQAAQLRATIKDISTDPASAVLKVEQATNKVLLDRQQIYARIREENASSAHNTAAYRGALGAIGGGAPADEAGRKAWLAKTLNETKLFEQQRIALAEDAAVKQEAINTRVMANYERVDAVAFDRQEMRRARLLDADEKRNAARIASDDRYFANYEYREALRENRDRDAAARGNATPGMTQDQRTAQRISNRNDALDYQGGAPMLMVQAKTLANYAAMGALLTAFSAGAKSVVDLETAMAELQAVTGSTNAEMSDLEKSIFAVGNSSKFSVKEISDTAVALGKAGYSASQIKEILPAVATLAAAAGGTMEEAWTGATAAMTLFNLGMDQSAKVTGQMTAVLNGTKLDFAGLNAGIQAAGTIAVASNVSFEETTAALGAMAEGGIKGSAAGMGLRNVLVQLDNPSKKFQQALKEMGLSTDDVSLKTHDLQTVMDTLKEKGFTAADAMHIFGVRAGSAFGALEGHLDTFTTLEASLNSVASATEAAKIQTDTMAATTQRLGNAVTQFMATAGAPFFNLLKVIIGALASVLQAATKLAPVFQVVGTIMASFITVAVIARIGAFTAGLLGMLPALASLNLGIIAASVLEGDFAIASVAATSGVRAFTLALLANPLTAWTVVLTLAVGALALFSAGQDAANAAMDKARGVAEQAKSEAEKYQSRVQELTTHIGTLTDRHAALSTNTQMAGNAATTAASKFGDWGLVMDSSSGKIDVLISRLRTLRGEMAAAQVDQLKIQRGALVTQRDQLASQASSAGNLGGKTDAANLLREGGTNLDPETRALIQKVQSGTATATEEQYLQSKLRRLSLPAGGMFGAPLQAYSSGLQAYLSDPKRAQKRDLDGQIHGLDTAIATGTVSSLPGGVAAGGGIGGLASWHADQTAAIARENDPAKRNQMAIALEKDMATKFAALNAQLGTQAAGLMKDGQVSNGMSQDQVLQQLKDSNPQYAELAIGSNAASGWTNDPKLLKQQMSTLAAQAALAKKGKDPARYKALMEKRKAISDQLLAAQNPDMDPEELAALQASSDAGQDAHIAAGGITHAGRIKKNQQDVDVDAALRAAEDHTDEAAGRAAGSGSDMTAVITAILKEYADARDKAVAAIKRRKPGADGEIEATAIIKKYDDAASKAALDILAAQMKGAADRDARITAAAQANIDSRRLNVAMLSNYSGQRNISDTQRYLGGMESHNIDVTAAGDKVAEEQRNLNRDNSDVWNKQAIYGKTGSKEDLKALEDARIKADGTAKALEKAAVAEKELVGKAKNFSTISQAIQGAWDVFADKAKLAEPVMSQIADGMEHTFETLHASLGTLVTGVLTGTMTMKQAFKSLAVSVLQSLMDMITKIIANKMLTMGLQMLSSFGGGGGGMPPGGSSIDVSSIMSSSGYAQGGEVTGDIPGRDSVPAMLMPGEVVMTKSAVDMAGRENLAKMNAAGNRSIDRMPTLSQAMGGNKPPMTNVWVTMPEHQPTMGKDDVLVAVSADILAGGQTKRLIKAVAMGRV